MGGNPVPSEKWACYLQLLSAGMIRYHAAERAGISRNAVDMLHKHPLRSSGFQQYQEWLNSNVRDVIPHSQLGQPAKKALRDFEYFRLRYFGHVSMPWQVEAANRMLELLESPRKEYVVVNVAPGSGKSTLWSHDIPIWAMIRNRGLRCLIGTGAENTGADYTQRIRMTLERTIPLAADEKEVALGLASDAAACLVHDFGRFKPEGSAYWRADKLVVAREGGQAAHQKESTFASYGQKSGFLGGRYDLCVWDDVVNDRNSRAPAQLEELSRWYRKQAECQPEWAEVNLPDGTTIEVGDVRVGTVLAGRDGPVTVTGVADQPDTEVFELTTRAGRVLHVTGNHPIWTAEGWTPAAQSLGAAVLAPPITTAGSLDPDDGALLGYLVGDGCTAFTNGNQRATFTNADENVIARFTALAEKKGWRVVRSPGRGRAWEMALACGVRDFIREHRIGCKAQDKRIPAEVMRARPEAQWAFLAAYFDCDGTIFGAERGSAQGRFATTSAGLTRDLAALCGRLGMPLRLGAPNRKNGVYRPCWAPSFSLPGLIRFAHNAPVVDTLKAARLAVVRAARRAPFPVPPVDRIDSVVSLGVMPVIGIETNDGTYATGDVVTHNTRLEPGGLLVLQGQRLGAHDLYRYALDIRDIADALDADVIDVEALPRKYHHIVFKAHYEETCPGPGPGKHHDPATAEPYPKGCLLDPKRLPYRDLRVIEHNDPKDYATVYQQLDSSPESVLVNPMWITGGENPVTHEVYPGCWDLDRMVGQWPPGLAGDVKSVVTADPSGSNFWGILWWGYQMDNGFQHLIDIERKRMAAPDLLDWNAASGCFTGLLEDWWQHSHDVGHDIGYVIFEANAAQRWLLQYDHATRWAATRRVQLVSHQTQRNKSDPELGVHTLAPEYRHGRVRWPGHPFTRNQMVPFYNEATRYPDSVTTDLVMSHWFLRWAAPTLFTRKLSKPPTFNRPTWLHDRRRGYVA